MPRRPSAAPSLMVLEAGAPGRSVEIDRDVFLIGRDGTCDLVLGRDRKVVSGEHARITLREGGCFVEDLGSRNGTFVDGQRVDGPVLLQDGQKIVICNYTLVFNQPSVLVREDDTSSTILGVLDASAEVPGRPASARPEEKLRGVLEIGRSLGGALGTRDVLDRALDALFRIFPQADRGFALLDDGDGARADFVPDAIKSRGGATRSLTISRTVFNKVMREAQAILSTDAANDSRLKASDSVANAQIRTMMCAPLLDAARRPMGILQLDARDDRGEFDQDDLDILLAVAGQVAATLENARLHEALLELAATRQETRDAAEVQKALLPQRRPELPGYEFWDAYEPARFVGGDYFDYLPMGAPGGAPRLAVALGDVTGKGMPAALLMARFSTEVRLFTLSGLDPVRIAERLNRDLCEVGVGDKFITFLLVALDAATHRMTVVNAGHMNPLVRRAGGRIEMIGHDEGCLPIGVLAGAAYRAATTSIEPGDVVVLYTDGVTDALDPHHQSFGTDRLRRALADARGGPADAGAAIHRAVRDFVAGTPQYDDITLLCFGRA